jgi:hypothetical protein
MLCGSTQTPRASPRGPVKSAAARALSHCRALGSEPWSLCTMGERLRVGSMMQSEWSAVSAEPSTAPEPALLQRETKLSVGRNREETFHL